MNCSSTAMCPSRAAYSAALRVVGEPLETAVTLSSARGSSGIDRAEIPKHGLHRRVQAVQIETVKPHPLFVRPQGIVVAQPLEEAHDFHIAPHPTREPSEVAERLFGAAIGALVTHEAIGPVGIGPVCFRGDDVEAFLRDERASELGTDAIELLRAVRRLTHQDETRIADSFEHRAEAVRLRLEPESGVPKEIARVVGHGCIAASACRARLRSSVTSASV